MAGPVHDSGRLTALDPQQFEYIDFSYKTEIWTYITHVNSTMSFYAQPVGYQQYVKPLAEPGAKLQADHITLQRVVIYNDVKNRGYIRAKIVNINGNKCNLFAIDFGHTYEFIDVQDLYEPLCKFPVLPLAIHCELANCNFLEDQANSRAVQAFCNFIDPGNAFLTIVGNVHGKYMVELLNSFGQDIIEMMILTEQHFGFAFSYNDINHINCRPSAKHNFLERSFSRGDKLNVTKLFGETLEIFYVAAVEKPKINVRIALASKQELDDLDVSQLVEQYPVVAYSKKGRYFGRGIVKVTDEWQKSADIYFVDDARTENVLWKDIKDVPEELFSIEAMAIKCTADKSQLYDYRCQKYFNPERTFYIEVLEPSSTSERNITKVLLSDI